MQRINLIKNQLNLNSKTGSSSRKNNLANKNPTKEKKQKEFINSAYDYLDFDEFLNPKEREYRLKLRKYLEELQPKLNQFYEKQEFPSDLIKKFFSDFPGLIAMHIKGYGSAEVSIWLGVAVMLELSRIGKNLI
jgi:hypothetical protein